MRARVRVGVLIFKKNKLLLIRHVNPLTNEEFWLTPGGGLKKEDKNIFKCAKREVLEECGLNVKLSKKIKYLRQWYDEENKRVQLEIFLVAKKYSGDITLTNLKGLGADEHWIKEIKFLGKKETKSLSVYPSSVKNPNRLLKKMKNGAIYLDWY